MKLLEVALLTGWIGVMGCITVNINFPPKEVEKAAEVIVGEARPPVEDGSATEPDPSGEGGSVAPGAGETPPAPGEEGAAPPSREPSPLSGKDDVPVEVEGETSPAPPREGARANPEGFPRGRSLLVTFPPAPLAAEDEKGESPNKDDIKITIDTPVIKKIRASLVARFKKLEPFYEKGAIGENRDGYLEVRDESKLALAEKRDLKALVAEENKDRKNLYLEIVKENRYGEERLKDVQRIFASQWAEKSRIGWWIQSKEGKWEKKAPPKKEKKEK